MREQDCKNRIHKLLSSSDESSANRRVNQNANNLRWLPQLNKREEKLTRIITQNQLPFAQRFPILLPPMPSSRMPSLNSMFSYAPTNLPCWNKLVNPCQHRQEVSTNLEMNKGVIVPIRPVHLIGKVEKGNKQSTHQTDLGSKETKNEGLKNNKEVDKIKNTIKKLKEMSEHTDGILTQLNGEVKAMREQKETILKIISPSENYIDIDSDERSKD
jgi:hypothetical protein